MSEVHDIIDRLEQLVETLEQRVNDLFDRVEAELRQAVAPHVLPGSVAPQGLAQHDPVPAPVVGDPGSTPAPADELEADEAPVDPEAAKQVASESEQAGFGGAAAGSSSSSSGFGGSSATGTGNAGSGVEVTPASPGPGEPPSTEGL